MSTTRSASPPAPATDTALVLCAHGTRGAAGCVGEHARALREAGEFAAVDACALYGAPRLETILDRTTAASVRLVPFMMAEGYTLEKLRQRVAGHPVGDRVVVTRALGAHPGLTDLLAAKARVCCEAAGRSPGETALLLVGHGATRHPASAATIEAHAARLRARGGFAEVRTGYLDQDPRVPDAVALFAAPVCVAVGMFTDAGDHGADDVPELLAGCGGINHYAGPIGPDPDVRALLLELARGGEPSAAPGVVEIVEADP